MLKRKDKILISALELFEEGGINNITTKNLAAKEGISEPALYRQYKNKYEIIKGVIKEYSSYDDRILNTIKKENLEGRDAIIYYVTRYAELYQSYSELSLVLSSMDLYFYKEETKEMMIQIIHRKEKFLVDYLNEHPIKNHRLSNETLSKTINDLLYSEVFRWRLAGKSYSLVDSINNYISNVIL